MARVEDPSWIRLAEITPLGQTRPNEPNFKIRQIVLKLGAPNFVKVKSSGSKQTQGKFKQAWARLGLAIKALA